MCNTIDKLRLISCAIMILLCNSPHAAAAQTPQGVTSGPIFTYGNTAPSGTQTYCMSIDGAHKVQYFSDVLTIDWDEDHGGVVKAWENFMKSHYNRGGGCEGSSRQHRDGIIQDALRQGYSIVLNGSQTPSSASIGGTRH